MLAILFRSWIKVCDAVVRAVDAIVPASVIKAGFCAMVGLSAWYGAKDGLEALCFGMVVATSVQAVAMLVLTRRCIRFEWVMLLKLSLPGLRVGLAALLGAVPALLLADALHWSLHLLLGAGGMVLGAFVLAWLRPQGMRVGPYDLLAQLATRLPSAALRKRWASGDSR